jgi:hypothetical protein
MVELKRTSPGPDSAALLFVARRCQNDQAMPLPASYARGAPWFRGNICAMAPNAPPKSPDERPMNAKLRELKGKNLTEP